MSKFYISHDLKDGSNFVCCNDCNITTVRECYPKEKHAEETTVEQVNEMI